MFENEGWRGWREFETANFSESIKMKLNSFNLLEVVLLCLLLNKPQLFSQHSTGYFQLVTLARVLHVTAYTSAILSHANSKTVQTKTIKI